MADTPEIRIKLDDSAGSAKFAADDYDVEAANLVEAVDKLSANLAAVSQQVSGDAADIGDTLRLMRQYAQGIHRRARDENASGEGAWIPFDIRQRFLAGAAGFSNTGKGEDITRLIGKLVAGGEVQLGSVAANTVAGIADDSLDESGREKAFLPKPEDYDESGAYRPNAKDDADDAQSMSDMTADDFTTDRASRKGQLEAQRQKETADLLYAERQERKRKQREKAARRQAIDERREAEEMRQARLANIRDTQQREAEDKLLDGDDRRRRGAPDGGRWGNIGAGIGGSLGAKLGGFRGGVIGVGLGKFAGGQSAGIAGGTGVAAGAVGILGPVAVGVTAVAVAAMAAKTALNGLAEKSDALAAKYADFSPQVGLAVAGREMATMQREFRYGQELGGDIAASQSRQIMRDDAYGEAGKEWDRVILKLDEVSTPLQLLEQEVVKGWAYIIGIIGPVLIDRIVPFLENLDRGRQGTVNAIAQAMSLMEGIAKGENMAELGKRMVDVAEIGQLQWKTHQEMLEELRKGNAQNPQELPIPDLNALFGTGHGGMEDRPAPVRPPRLPPNRHPDEDGPPPGVNF